MKPFKIVLLAATGLAVIFVIALVVGLAAFSNKLPPIENLRNYQPLLVTTVYSDDDKVIAEFSTERRFALPTSDIPKVLVNAFVSAEDDEFFTHRGVNPLTILRAAIRNLQAGHTVQGGSTITQQVAKSIFLSPERSMSRKIKEMLLAFKIEKALTKEEILNLYLNQIFLGNGAYGVESASQVYFGKHAKDLTIPEAAILAGLPRAPSRDNPIANPKAARNRQLYVLGRMLATSSISRTEYEEAVNTQVHIKNRALGLDTPAPYFSEYVRRYLVQKYGTDTVYGGGLKVYTTMNLNAQLAAQAAIKTGLLAVDKRIGLRQPTRHLKSFEERAGFIKQQHKELVEDYYDFQVLGLKGELTSPVGLGEPSPVAMDKTYPAVVVDKDHASRSLIVSVGNRRGMIKPADYVWASYANGEELYTEKVVREPFNQLNVGDIIQVKAKTLRINGVGKDEFTLEQQPLVQGALVSYGVPDGALKAMVGGYDFKVTKSEFNRAIQAMRQPGSSFKPIIYACALDNGLTPATIIVDSPIVYRDSDEQSKMEKTWKPENSTDKFYGDTTLRNALAFSRNIPTIKVLQHLKIPTAIEYARKIGIKSPLANDLSIALGSSAVNLDELVRAEATFANHGKKLNPYFIRKVEDRAGTVLEQHQEVAADQLIPDSTAFLITSMMRSVVDIGTGAVVKGLNRPVAGKTGTTNDFKDAWFLGFIPQMFTGVWVGFDEDRPLGRNESGAFAAAPIWLQYMQKAVNGLPVQDFEVPSSVIQVQLDTDTGDLPTAKTKRRYTEYFNNGTAPGQPAPVVATNGATAPSGTGNPAQNHTKVITGNAERPRTGNSGADEDSDVGTDELYRNEL